MPMILNPKPENCHYYRRDCTAFYEVERSDGKGTRKATVADARKVGAVPSPTTILKVLASPGLENWKREQLLLAAMTLPRFPGEDDAAFVHRIVEDADAYTEKAMDLGTAIHAACEAYAINRYVPTDPKIVPLFMPYKLWFDEFVESVIATEKIMVHQAEGYGGRVDLIARIKKAGVVLCDVKTQGMKASKKTGEYKPNIYETWPLQLISYMKMAQETGDFNPPDSIASIIINTTAPSPVHFHVYPQGELESYWSVFKAVFACWKFLKGYDPTKEPRP